MKLAFKDYICGKLPFTPRTEDNLRPRIGAISHKSECFKRSISYRRYKLWNSLPKDLVIKDMSYDQFCCLTTEWIKEKRVYLN